MKKLYEEPSVEILYLTEDVVTLSLGGDNGVPDTDPSDELYGGGERRW